MSDAESQPEVEKPIENRLMKEVPISHIIPAELPLLFSDQMVVKGQEDGLFVLYFFQTRPPIAVTTEQVEAVEKIDAKCVAQIIVTPQQMQKNIAAMNTNFQRQLSKTGKVRLEQVAEEGVDGNDKN